MGIEQMQPLVAPFFGERYSSPDQMSDLISPPYDVISPEKRERLASTNRKNVVCVTLPGGSDPYATAASILDDWRASGVIVRDPGESVYVLRQTYQVHGVTHARTGVIAGVSVEPYETGRVRPHEKTHSHVKEDRLALLRSTRTMCESLFFLAPDRDGSLKDLLASATSADPDVRTELEGVGVELWIVDGDLGAQIASSAGTTHIYIADGHHRFETGWAYRDEEPSATRTLALIVPLGDPGLIVLPTHRVLDGSSVSRNDVEMLLNGRFNMRALAAGETPTTAIASSNSTACVVSLSGGEKVLCEMKPDADISDFTESRDSAVASLDIARVDALVVDPLKELSDATISYSASADEVEQKLAAGSSLAVIVRATGVEEVVRVADAGAVMPQKATYFIPKVPSGMVFLNLAEQGER